MRNNPFEPNGQPTDVVARERMADLPAKRPQPAPAPIVATSASADQAEIRQEEAQTVRYAISKMNDFLQWFMIVLQVTLGIRFLLRLIGADPGNLFAGFLFALTDIVLFPFRDIVKIPPFRANQVFELYTLIAMVIYALLFWAVRRFLRILVSSPEEPAQ